MICSILLNVFVDLWKLGIQICFYPVLCVDRSPGSCRLGFVGKWTTHECSNVQGRSRMF